MTTILLVEDEEFLRKLIAKILELNGFHVIQAIDGVNAYNLLNCENINLILCDIMMPKMNGFEFLEKIKLEIKFKDIPFVFLSAMVAPDDIKEGFNLGANDFLKKPIDIDECLKCLHKFVPL